MFQDFKKDIRYFLVKSDNCTTYVQHGIADIGVMGKDTLLEGGKDYYEMLDSGVGRCKFIVAGLREHNLLNKVGYVEIRMRYPNIAGQYFLEEGMDMGCVRIDGSVELASTLGSCDEIVDIMETGTTLRENGLVVFDTVCNISARVIVDKAGFKLKGVEILAILEDTKKELETC